MSSTPSPLDTPSATNKALSYQPDPMFLYTGGSRRRLENLDCGNQWPIFGGSYLTRQQLIQYANSPNFTLIVGTGEGQETFKVKRDYLREIPYFHPIFENDGIDTGELPDDSPKAFDLLIRSMTRGLPLAKDLTPDNIGDLVDLWFLGESIHLQRLRYEVGQILWDRIAAEHADYLEVMERAYTVATNTSNRSLTPLRFLFVHKALLLGRKGTWPGSLFNNLVGTQFGTDFGKWTAFYNSASEENIALCECEEWDDCYRDHMLDLLFDNGVGLESPKGFGDWAHVEARSRDREFHKWLGLR